MLKKELRHIGHESDRYIGEQILTGRAEYTKDIKLKGMLYGKILRSPLPHAEIMKIDKSKALAMQGVAAVVTWDEVPRNIYVTNGFTPPPHCHIMDKVVRYIGDAVALVVADSEDIAEEAMELIEVEYKILKPVFTMDDALQPDAPQLYPEFPNNIAPHKNNLNFNVGDVAKGFEEADLVIEEKHSMESGQNPLPVEPPSIICSWEGDFLTVIGSIAAIAYCQQNVAAAMDMPYEKIRTVAPCVGGSFGSKLFSGNVQPILYTALMAKAARKPVRFCYTKEEHFAAHQVRMSTDANIKLGLKKDGTVTAIEIDQKADAGYCASTQEFMLGVGTVTLPFLCKTLNQKYDGKVVLTNKVPSGSFRGYGYLESTALITRVIFNACEQLGIDPLEYFKKNALIPGELFYDACNRGYQNSAGPDWASLFQKTADLFGWDKKWKGWGVPTAVNGKKIRAVGVGVAGQNHVGGKPSNANVSITGLGSVFVQTCMTEFGAGTRDVMRKMAAEELNMPLESVTLSTTDTTVTPPDFGSTGSRSTYCGGIAVVMAARELKNKMFALCEEKFKIPADDCEFKDGVVFRKSNPEEKYPLLSFLGKVDGLTGSGHFEGTHNVTMYNIQFVEIEVDKELGTFEVVEHYEGADAGVIVNPLPLKNQMESFFAGIDLATYEETIWDENDNRVLNPSMIDYKVRTFNNVPKHNHLVLESFKTQETELPFGAFGAGEPTLSPGGPAIAMALYNALGIKIESYPYLPGKVLAALKEKEAK